MFWDDINCEFEKNYSPLRCYNQSKLANVLFAQEFSKRFKGRHFLKTRLKIAHMI